jgi:hypothetical protein
LGLRTPHGDLQDACGHDDSETLSEKTQSKGTVHPDIKDVAETKLRYRAAPS